jgi:transposase InsO family protein
VQDRPPSRENANAADGDRGALSPSADEKPEPGHKIYPYLLGGIEIKRPNQVWAMDITYIPMERGFVYLAVVLDWFSRRMLSWGSRSPWRRHSASRRSRTLSFVTASRRAPWCR